MRIFICLGLEYSKQSPKELSKWSQGVDYKNSSSGLWSSNDLKNGGLENPNLSHKCKNNPTQCRRQIFESILHNFQSTIIEAFGLTF